MADRIQVKNRLVDFACYVALVIAAIILLINNILPLCNINISGKALDILNVIQQIAVLVGIAAGAYKFSRNTGSIVYKIIYLVAVIIYIVAIILIFFRK